MKPLLREAFRGEISEELLWRPKVFFAKGARTGDLIESMKGELNQRLKQKFKYKNDITADKFFG
jgi:hypothetical protein